MCKINLNQEKNGIELSFEKKPEASTLDAIKKQGFKWNRARRVWYAKQTPDNLTFAESLGSLEPAAAVKPGKINLDNLGSNNPGCYGGAELSKAIREELKRRGVKGCTVKVSHYDSITVTWTPSESHFASVEEARERYNIGNFYYDRIERGGVWDNEQHRYITGDIWQNMTEEERAAYFDMWLSKMIESFSNFYATNGIFEDKRPEYFELSAAGFDYLVAIVRIANQWNYNRSDAYSDYHDVGYYLDIDIKHPDGFTVRDNMTEEERAALNQERAEEAKERAEALAKMEKEQKEAEEAARKFEEYRKEAEARIYNNISVEDLAEDNEIYIKDVLTGIGKESTYKELQKTVEEEERKTDAVIDRVITFTDRAAFDDFCNLFLNDWIFLSNKGGSYTEDARINSTADYSALNEEQRENIKWFSVHCVGIALDNKLQLVIDPQGYSYARYVFIVSDDSIILNAKEERARQRAASEAAPGFYIPAPISKQIENITTGQDITIFKCDGWLLNNVEAGRGTVEDIAPGSYAQYTGYYITFTNGRRVFIRDNNDCLIYPGLYTLPDAVKTEKVSENMYRLYGIFDGLFDRVKAYFDGQGIAPLLNTIPGYM